jgi:hypothetical protein
MPVIEFVGQSLRSDASIAVAPSRLVNCYREPTGEGTFVLQPVPGLTSFADLPGIFVREMAVVDGQLYAACGGRLYRITQEGFTDLGGIEDGPTSISGNTGLPTVCAGGRYWVLDGSLTEPAAGAFSGFGGVEFFGGYTILTEANGRRFQWSDLANPLNLPGLNFASAEGRDDNLIRPVAINGMLYLWKEDSHEIWYQTGGAGAEAFERVAGGVRDVGLKAFGLISLIPGGAFIVGSDGRAHLVSGATQPISTPAVEAAIRDSGPVKCATYEEAGHTFCVIVFPGRAAWVYDIATGEWHERAEGLGLDAWGLSATAKWRGQWYAGRNDGRVFRFGGTTDSGVPVIKQATSRTLRGETRFVVRDVELLTRKGLEESGLTMAASGDDGVTFGPEKSLSLGPIGRTDQRLNWRARFGQFRQFTARVTWDGSFPVRADARVTL